MKKLVFTLILCISFILCGCSLISFKKDKGIIDKEEKTSVVEDKSTETSVKKAVYSPYTGEELSDDAKDLIPFMAIIENSKAARPQSGLIDADIVFETMAEGGIPRFIALFYGNSPKIIGPIRSVRPYFLNLAEEFTLPFAHCGGSEEATISIQKGKGKSMDEAANGSFYWRDKTRKSPHNLYTSTEKLRALISKKNFLVSPSSTLKFDKASWNNGNFTSAKEVIIKPNKNYNTSYTYKDEKYMKSMDNEPSIDRENKKNIYADNIIIQKTDIALQKDGIHIDIRLTGQGEGFLISQGKYQKIKWSKKGDASPTLLTDESGKAVNLSPGKTWWHIVNKSDMIVINGD